MSEALGQRSGTARHLCCGAVGEALNASPRYKRAPWFLPQCRSSPKRSDRLHLGQVVADGIGAAADPRVMSDQGLGDLRKVERQRFSRHVASAAHRIMTHSAVLEVILQERFDVAFGG